MSRDIAFLFIKAIIFFISSGLPSLIIHAEKQLFTVSPTFTLTIYKKRAKKIARLRKVSAPGSEFFP